MDGLSPPSGNTSASWRTSSFSTDNDPNCASCLTAQQAAALGTYDQPAASQNPKYWHVRNTG
jgi:hypothetical protein